MEPGATLESIELIYRSRYDDFLRTASAIADGREAGRDAVHDAFVAAVRERRKFRGDGTLEAWVWPMVVRSALKRRRRPGEDPLGDESSDAVWTETPQDGTGEVRAAVAALPERQRLVLFLRYYGDLDYQTIAEAAGVRVGTVGAELHAAHASLRRFLKEAVGRD
jgi:RNA polymerase sigma-70 factor (ECF subfamily)